jgi:hypothetical protein
MINLRENIWACPMPDAEGAEIRGEHPGRPYQILSFYGEAEAVDLPPGTWEIVCTSKEATEDDCAIIAGLSFQDVVHGYSRTLFHDQLTSKGCDLNKNWLILKKQ